MPPCYHPFVHNVAISYSHLDCRCANASATSRTVSPGMIVSAGGWTMTDVATCVTRTVPTADTESAVAAILVVPLPMAVANPVEFTTATRVSVLNQTTSGVTITAPFASRTVALKLAVSPSATRNNVSGSRCTAIATCVTLTTTDALARPAVAVTVALPLPAAATSPLASTVATPSSEEDHVTATCMVWPCWSKTVAETRAVSPIARRRIDVGERSILVATGPGGGSGPVCP